MFDHRDENIIISLRTAATQQQHTDIFLCVSLPVPVSVSLSVNVTVFVSITKQHPNVIPAFCVCLIVWTLSLCMGVGM